MVATMAETTHLHEALQTFADRVTRKFSGLAAGEPEAQLSSPTQDLAQALGAACGFDLTLQDESRAGERIGIPDFAVSHERLLIGYLEMKSPGTGADAPNFTGRNRDQWQRFKDLPNILYTDGNEWALFQEGQRHGRVVRLSGDVTTDGAAAATAEDATALHELFSTFLQWDVIPPRTAKQLAEMIAPICRILRKEVNEALQDIRSPLVRLANDWREHLFPDASNDRFADSYAQVVTFALLLARAEDADVLNLDNAVHALEGDHTLLARALRVMTDEQAEAEIRPALRLVQRMVASVQPYTLSASSNKSDPWLYFYEEFLAAYDPELRKDAGAYYTPVEVVTAQVRLVDQLLIDRLGMRMGFAQGGNVITLDPAVGTGTYLLGIIDHAMARVAEEEGQGAVQARASLLWQNIHGFEYLVSPYAVAELRLTQSLLKYGGSMPGGGPPVYLTNTLESPHTQPPDHPLFYEPIAQEHNRALQVKDRTHVRVCIGNPPYDRHESASLKNLSRTGGWVRFGDSLRETESQFTKSGRPRQRRNRSEQQILTDRQKQSILHEAYIKPVIDAGHGGHLKNLYNLYVYFWRWAFWKVFEHTTTPGPGIVSYISASSYLDGYAFVGMREHMRRSCDEIWIIDLGGEGRGTRREENVFAIQTPVAIAIAMRATRISQEDTPATVHYARIKGPRDAKLAKLTSITSFSDLDWEECPDDWHAPFLPAGVGQFFEWPRITDLMPWQHSGVQVKRTWPIAADPAVLERRWRTLLTAADRATAFRETSDRHITSEYKSVAPKGGRDEAIATLRPDTPIPEIRRYAYRSFDRQFIIADGRLISRPRPELWESHSEKQIYFTSLFNHPLGGGPAITAAAEIPDLHHFRGSYGSKEVIPLFRDASAKHPNILPGLLEMLSNCYGRNISPEDWAAYLYGALAHPSYTHRFHEELINREVRIPLTKEADLFQQVAAIGKRLIWLHTYGERMVPNGQQRGSIPKGRARCTKAVPDDPTAYPESFDYDPDRQTLIVGHGEFSPVALEVWDFEVSGLKVVQSWLGYRMKRRSGKTSSPLDAIGPDNWMPESTTELLHLLWILEHTLTAYPEQRELLDQVLSGTLFQAYDIPAPPSKMRKSPSVRKRRAGQTNFLDEEP